MPGSYVRMGDHGTGCFNTAPDVSVGKHSLLQLSLHPACRSCFVGIEALPLDYRPTGLEALYTFNTNEEQVTA